MGLFGAKKEEENKPVNSIPVNQVIEMKNRNLSNNQIVEALQKDGFSTTQIFDALSQAEISTNPEVNVNQPLGQVSNPLNLETPPEIPNYQPMQQGYYQQPMQQAYQQPMQQQPAFDEKELNDKIEEVTEAIIEEKWKDFAETIEKIIDWKNAMQEKFDGFERDLAFLKQEFDKIHGALIKKIDQYDKGMSDVGAQLKAMEMVFKDILPKFTENVNVLSSFADKVKKKK